MGFERSCLSDHIRRELARRILDGTLKPGERLLELKIAAEFESSQTPVREALRELESLRLVESSPYKGTRVREVGDHETAEAYAVKGSLERLAAETAAAGFKGDAKALRATVDALIAEAARGDREGYARHDLDFHRAIVRAAGNGTLLQIWESLAFETRTRITLARRDLDWPSIARWHSLVVDALEAGDGATAGRLLEAHARSFMSPPPAPAPAKVARKPKSPSPNKS
ncbi:GntR family transcriptional regulator [Paludisphaera mucosa]|uniref:GntR family transcriptional regulator n=1 Tax=Paludisphaera mucosa TaxID=3030827 RepID=A0ABT6FJ00_9BACT|nr:GntR family transcriptional regulator [Paludisphaera mucosa]MDG3007563.1 GntR family transcriptional regulator [Paludisphaera mucosa]